MSDSYYDRLVSEVADLIDEKNYEKAMLLIDNELNMPYVPEATEKKLKEFRQQIVSENSSEKKRYFLSREEVTAYLFSGNERCEVALAFLSSSNVRDYTDIIQDYFLSENNDCFIVTELITILKNQQVSQQFRLLKNGIILTFSPEELPYVFQQEEFEKIYNDLNGFFENENPSFLQLTKQTLINFAFSLYPITLEEKDHDKVLYSVIRYVFMGYDDQQGFEQFAAKHNVNTEDLIKISI